MGIDRIGKGAPPPPPAPIEKSTDAAAPFAVRGTEGDAARAFGAGAAGALQGKGALERLRAGEIDQATYVEIKVEEATKHLTGLRPADLEAIKAELRHRVAADPTLADLAHQATGSRLTTPAEDDE